MSNKNDRWSALSMKERADLMNVYVSGGILDLKEMKRHYNSFGDGGDTEEGTNSKGYTTTSKQDLKDLETFNSNWYKYRDKQILDAFDSNDSYVKYYTKGLNNWQQEFASFLKDETVTDAARNYINDKLSNIKEFTFEEALKDGQTRKWLQDFYFEHFPKEKPDANLIGPPKPVSDYDLEFLSWLYNGLTSQDDNSIIYFDDNHNTSTKIHERTHLSVPFKRGWSRHPFLEGINKVVLKDGVDADGLYYDSPSEVYARLMQLRFDNKLDPSYTYTKEDLEAMRNDPNFKDHNIFNRYTDDSILMLLNDIAHNTQDENKLDYINPDNIAAFGGELNSFIGEEDQNNEEVLYYDDTYIEPAVVKAFNSKEEYNRYYGEQFGKKVAEGMNNAAPYVLEAAMLPFTISGAVETPMLLYQGVKAAPQLIRGAKTLLTKGKKAFGKKVLGMVDDMNDYVKEGSHFRIVDKPAIDDAIESGLIRAKTGLHHDAVTYLKNNFSDYLKDIPGWDRMDANDLRGILESKGAFNNGGDALRREAMLQIRNSTNHGGSVHYFKGMPYPNYEITPTNYIIETPENIGSFVAGHGGKEFIDMPLENAGSTLLKTNGSVKGASIPSKGSSYWEYSPFFEMWKNKKFNNGGKLLTKKFESGGNTQFYNLPIFGLGFENHFSIPQNTIVDTPKTPQVYEVQQGDSFIKIANSLGVPLDEFKKVNPLENYNSISIGQKLVIPEVKQVEQPEIRQSEESKFNQYTVGEGDNLSVIAKKNNMSLDALIKANPQIKNPNIISVGQKINLTSPTTPKKVREKQWISVDELREKEKEYNKTNLGAIQGATHDSNYVVIDKKGKKLTVYDSDNNVVYETSDISTGLSGNDYNTKTFTRNGRDVYGEGNMSTPAGVTRISSMDMYHGAPSFQRVRLDSYGNPKKVYDKNGKEIDDTINSSFHLGSIDKLYSSNGCVRMSKKALNDLSKYIDVGTLVYTLPDKNESRFVLKDGNLNYEADNPFGVTEKGKTFNKYGHDMVYQDDYNVFNNKTSSPIKIEYTGNTKNPFKKDNIESIISGITSNKESLQKAFNVSDQHFNKIAQLALGILEQESKFGTHYRYIGKQAADKIPFTNSTATAIANSNPNSTNINGYAESNYHGETLLDFIKHVSGNNTYDSLGMGQIKMEGDNEETQKMYRMFNVTPENVRSDEKTAEAIMIRLLSMYRNEVQGREFKNKETGAIIDPYDALLYKYKGGTAAKVLRKGEATGKNTYVLNVKNYAKDFKFYTYK